MRFAPEGKSRTCFRGHNLSGRRPRSTIISRSSAENENPVTPPELWRGLLESCAREFGWPLLRESRDAFDKVFGLAGLLLRLFFLVELHFVGIVRTVPIEAADERERLRRTIGQPRREFQGIVHQSAVIADTIDKA